VLIVIEHLPHEGAGLLGRLADELHVPTRVVRVHAGDVVPARVGEGDALVVLGGDMNTDEGDRFPHLHDERSLLATAVDDGTPVLGICLGAQLLAEAAGGRVRHVGPSCGYVPLELTPAGRDDPLTASLPAAAQVLNLNGDHIELGGEATLLAQSPGLATQAFRVGARAYGVQFHPEFDRPAVQRLLEEPSIEAYLRAGGSSGAQLLTDVASLPATCAEATRGLLRRWLVAATSTAGATLTSSWHTAECTREPGAPG
jgi:GMP synthase (glutamine-hydrolysing)